MDAEARVTKKIQTRPVGEPALERILAAWRCRMRATLDAHPRSGDRGVRERALVRALLGYAGEPVDGTPGGASQNEDRLEALALAAALYGANMPRERLDPATLCSDLSELRESVWEELGIRDLSAAEQAKCVQRYDEGLSVALRAALTGGYRLTPPDGRAFPELLEDVIADCSSGRQQSASRTGADLS